MFRKAWPPGSCGICHLSSALTWKLSLLQQQPPTCEPQQCALAWFHVPTSEPTPAAMHSYSPELTACQRRLSSCPSPLSQPFLLLVSRPFPLFSLPPGFYTSCTVMHWVFTDRVMGLFTPALCAHCPEEWAGESLSPSSAGWTFPPSFLPPFPSPSR